MPEATDAPGPRLPKGWRRKVVAALRESGVLSYAADQVGVSRSTILRYRQSDPAFNAACEDAIDAACDGLEFEARRRAMAGSDTLLMFLLKGNRPHKYRDTAPPQQGVTAADAVKDMQAAAESYESRRDPVGSDGVPGGSGEVQPDDPGSQPVLAPSA